MISKSAKPLVKEPVKSGKPSKDVDEIIELESLEGTAYQDDSKKVAIQKQDSLDELDKDLNDRVEMLQDDMDMADLIKDFNDTEKMKKSSMKGGKKKPEPINK